MMPGISIFVHVCFRELRSQRLGSPARSGDVSPRLRLGKLKCNLSTHIGAEHAWNLNTSLFLLIVF